MTAPTPRRHVMLLCVTALVTLLLDQATKAIALERLVPGERTDVLGSWLGWRLVFNPGAAFSFGTGVTWIFTVVMGVVAIAVLVGARRIYSRPWAFALGALLGGAMGNLVDRLAREPGFGVGHVVDFIDYGVFIGNVADIAIVGSALLMVLLSLLGYGWDRPGRHPHERDSASDAESNGASDGASDGEPDSASDGEPDPAREGDEPTTPDGERSPLRGAVAGSSAPAPDGERSPSQVGVADTERPAPNGSPA
ncbi:MAG TPA: hypothetical protein DHV14_01965 [Micrococcales bacterium]|uniref:signal peptidase II n=1 Tax=Miniimonas arenae TaxID=676201 RepID=UPI000ED3AC8F|nr:signal peptidase II [Miniimonas arenae]HCX83905.1 hypothetical protein [Micrococcales bacterium]